jgi:4-carboxymuconolactone decarboxylase
MAAARLDPTPIIDAVGPYADTVATLEDRAAGYREMIGFLPPRVEARLHLTGALDPVILDMQEKVRAPAIEQSAFRSRRS